MPLLPAPWCLHDVDDVEALIARALSRSRSADRLRPDERDDLTSELFGVAWKLAGRHQPARGKFSTVLYIASQRRAIDFVRRELGRTTWQFSGHTHTRVVPQIVSLDERDPLGDAHTGGAGGRPADRPATLDGLLDHRDGETDRDLAIIRTLRP